jgi:hypothetical protein
MGFFGMPTLRGAERAHRFVSQKAGSSAADGGETEWILGKARIEDFRREAGVDHRRL